MKQQHLFLHIMPGYSLSLDFEVFLLESSGVAKKSFNDGHNSVMIVTKKY
jgi:hypothetical protein